MKKILIICGPTGTGKTELGVGLAKKLSGEIVSADSRQVYRGMDIGTGKDLPKNSEFRSRNSELEIVKRGFSVGYYDFNGVPVWLYDVVGPDQDFSVADYYKLVWKVIEDIWQRGKLPILVGGTGFYIKAVIDGIDSLGIEPDWELRKTLENKDVKILGEELKKLNPQRWERMNESDRVNPRRLIRAIEIAKKNQKSKIKNQPFDFAKGKNAKFKIDKLLMVGLASPYETLYQRIDRRVEERVRRGAAEEIESLLKKGCRWNLPSMSGMGYREFKDFFEKKATLGEVVQRWKFDEHGYARRQMTWFRKDSRIKWFNVGENGWQDQVEDLVVQWYNLC